MQLAFLEPPLTLTLTLTLTLRSWRSWSLLAASHAALQRQATSVLALRSRRVLGEALREWGARTSPGEQLQAQALGASTLLLGLLLQVRLGAG